MALIDSGVDPRHNALQESRALHHGLHRRQRHGPFRPRDACGGHHRRPSRASADTRMYRGVAPGAYLVNLRVLDNNGEGTASDVIDAIDWAIDHRATTTSA